MAKTKIPGGYIADNAITGDHIADNVITSAMLHTSFTVSSSNLSSIDTDNVSEGASNLYFTNARARGAISVSGDLSYNSSTGVISFTNDAGDIESVVAGSGLTGGGTSGDVTLNIGAGTGITVNADDIAVNMSAFDTDNLSEGASNLYFTNERVDDRVNSLLTAGTGITLTYDDANNTLTIAGAAQYGDSDVESYLSGGTGVTFSSGVISIGQDVSTSATPTFGNTTLTGYLRGPSSFTIDPATHGDDTGTVVIAGNLQVDGTTTTINSTTLSVSDKQVTLGYDATTDAANNNAGIVVYRPETSDAYILWSETDGRFNINRNLAISQDLYVNASGVQDTTIEIGAGTASNHYAYIDLIGDATYTDYGLRIIRNNGGANTSSYIYHRGTGNFNIETQEAASILLRTAGVTALTLDSSQNATFKENVYIGSADTTNGTLTIHGGGTGNNEGGEIRLATAADHDSVYNFYRIDVNSDDLRFGREGETDLIIKNTGSIVIEKAADGLIFPSSHSEDKIRMYDGGSEKIGTASGQLILTGNTINFKKVGGTPDLAINGTTFLNSSIELTNIASINTDTAFIGNGNTNNISHGALVINHGTLPQILFDGGGDTNLDIAVPNGEILQIGHWNTTTNSAVLQLSMETDGDFSFEGNNIQGVASLTMANSLTITGDDKQVKFTGTAGPLGFDFGDSEANPNFRAYYRTGPNTFTFENNGETAKHTWDLDGDYTAVGTITSSSGTSSFNAADIAQIEIGDGGTSAATDASNIGSKANYLLLQRDEALPIEIWGSRIESRSTHYFGGGSVDAEANIDTSGNFTTTGTISSGAITTSDRLTVTGVGSDNTQPSTNYGYFSGYGAIGNRGTFYVTNGGGAVQIGNGNIHNSNPTATFSTSVVNLGSGRALQMNGTTVITSSRNLTNIGTISSGAITSSGQVEGTSLKIENGTHDGFFGSASFSWGGSTQYPTLYSSHSDRWVMMAFPHVTYLQNGTNSHTGSTTGATMRMAANPSASAYWDIGIGSTTDLFRIGREGSNAMTINSSLNTSFTGTISSGAITSSDSITTSKSDGGRLIFSNQTHNDNKIYLHGTTGGERIGTSSGKIVYSAGSHNFKGSAGSGAGNIQLNDTTVIDTSRNLTNIGTYSGSGDMTINKNGDPIFTIQTSQGSGDDALIRIRGARTSSSTSDIAKIQFDNKTSSAYTMAEITARDPSGSHTLGRGSLIFRTSSGGTLSDALLINRDKSATFYDNVVLSGGALQMNGTTVIDTSRNLTNIGTVGCGAITGSSWITVSDYVQHYGFLYSRNNLRVLNAAGNDWVTWAQRANSTFNLDVGTIDSAQITSTGGGSSTSATLTLNSSTSSTFNHAINAFNSSLTSGENNVIIVGKEGSTKNSGYIGYKWNGAGGNNNLLTFGHWGNDNLMNLAADGKLGLGTQSPSVTFHAVSAGTNSQFYFQSPTPVIRGIDSNLTTRYWEIGGENGNCNIAVDNGNAQGSSNFGVTIDGQQAFYIDSDDRNYVNTSSNPTPTNATGHLNVLADLGDGVNIKHTVNGNNTINIWQTGTTVHSAIAFYKGNTQTNRGTIRVDTNGTSYTSPSDYRLKENVVPMSNATTRVMAMNPVQFDWIESGATAEGFLAHELAEQCPAAVVGEKDAVYGNGDINPQNVDPGKITPLLVKTIQEQQALIESLQTRIEALEGE